MAIKELRYGGFKTPLVYQDKDLIVANKPAGLLTVPIGDSKADNLESGLREVLRHQTKEIQAVHRIDRYTSGLVVFAKNQLSGRKLTQLFMDHTPKRIYRALVWGDPKEEETLTGFYKLIQHGFKNVPTKDDDPKGTKAVMSYRTLARYNGAAIVEVQLQTGLKNQIRAQMAKAGLPLVGERQYAEMKDPKVFKRQMLHAYQLSFIHPRTGREMDFKVDAPKDFDRALNELKKR